MDARWRNAADDADDRTVLIDRPAGTAARSPRSRATANSELQRLVAGVNPLVAAAHVLLALVAPLRTTTTHSDPQALHRHLLGRLHEFERDARAAGVAVPKLGAARYVLCCFLDEVVAATPWGGGARGLLAEFHDDPDPGDKAFKLLDRLGEDAAGNRDLLELFYVCIALGFEGRYRNVPNGRAQLDAIAERLYQLVHTPATSSRTLSLRWQGLAAQHWRTLSVLPLWAVVAVGAALAVGALVAASAALDARTAPLARQLVTVPALLADPRVSAAAAHPRLVPRLQADVAAGRLAVRDEALRSVVTVPADALFAAGSARVEPAQAALLDRIARALADLPGQVVVSGHTDAGTPPSLQFPTGWHLSRARALAVVDALAAHGVAASRLRGEGRGDAEPVAAPASPGAAARNRRVEIVLVLPRPDAP